MSLLLFVLAILECSKVHTHSGVESHSNARVIDTMVDVLCNQIQIIFLKNCFFVEILYMF